MVAFPQIDCTQKFSALEIFTRQPGLSNDREIRSYRYFTLSGRNYYRLTTVIKFLVTAAL